MVSDFVDRFQHQSNWPDQEQLDDNKDSTSTQEFYRCQYRPDLGPDDSDPESQSSDASSQSQGSAHSPATSYSSEESRADQSQRFNDTSDEYSHMGPVSTGTINTCETSITYPLPHRPKVDTDSSQKAPRQGLIEEIPSAVALPLSSYPNNDLSNIQTLYTQNPRRGRSIVGTIPSLRRDTDPTDNIVRMIVLFCTNLINSIWCTQGQSPSENASRQGGNVLPLDVFITETLRRSKTSYSTLQIALYYLILLKQCVPAQAADKSGCRAMQCGRRMFLTSLILASKYLQDRNYSARAWSKISGLPLKEINDNERRFLAIVNWDLHVPKCTFENWSKIVLQVCRRSQDISGACKSPDNFSGGPRSGPPGAQHCLLPNGSNRNWWLVNLRQLKTDVVKCAIKTQNYVESLCPFKPVTPMSRPVSPGSDVSEDSYDSLADILVETPTSSRQSSLDRSSKRFEPVADLLHPAAPLAMPPQPMLKNLPTPLTTPQSNVQNYWTPRLAHQSSSSSLRCKASASALGSAFKKHCPIANLETCPPPPPPHRTCDKVQRSCIPVDNVYSSSNSAVSSPESTVSDVFSATARSRSSSISSTSSWGTSCLGKNELRFFSGSVGAAPCLTRPSLQPVTGYVSAEQAIERPVTAFKVPQVSTEKYYGPSPWTREELKPSCSTYEQSLDSKARKSQIEAILAGRQVDESVVRSRARPALSRNQTQIYKPRQEQETKNQPLKRSRSDNFEFSSVSSSKQLTPLPTPPPERAANPTFAVMESNDLRVQPPTQDWARPRKPYQTGTHQNKRLALQCSIPNFAAADLASWALKSDLVSRYE